MVIAVVSLEDYLGGFSSPLGTGTSFVAKLPCSFILDYDLDNDRICLKC